MTKSVLLIVGSASSHSSNHKLMQIVADQLQSVFTVEIIEDLKVLPPFDPSVSSENTPIEIKQFRQKIEHADGILISTPE